MGSPNFALVGTSTAPAALLIGFCEAAIRRVVTAVNASTSATLALVKGEIMIRNAAGAFVPLAESDLTARRGLTSVVDEAVGTGDNSVKAFYLDHPEVLASSLVVKVGGTATTAFAFDAETGLITFGTAPTTDAAITASYEYYDAALAARPLPLAIVEAPVTVPKGTVGTPGAITFNAILRGEVASDLLRLESVAWKDLSAGNKLLVENLLAESGIVLGTVIR